MRMTGRKTCLIAGLTILVIAVGAAVLMIVITNRHFHAHIQDLAEFAKAAVVAELNRSNATGKPSVHINEVPYRNIEGIEIFSKDGRRMWGTGKPLEIIGYQLDRSTMLIHQPPGRQAFEFFWPASMLEEDYGVAIRLDTSNLTRSRYQILSLTLPLIIVSIIIASFSTYLLTRRRMRTEGAEDHAFRNI